MSNPFDGNNGQSGQQPGGDYGHNSYGSSGSTNDNAYGGNTYGTNQGNFAGSSFESSYGSSYYGESSNAAGQGAYGQGAYGQGYQQLGGYEGFNQQHNGLTVAPLDAMDSLGQAFKGYFKQPLPGALASLAYFAIMAAVVLVPLFIVGLFAEANSTARYQLESGADPSATDAAIGVVGVLVMLIVYLLAFLIMTWMNAGSYSAARKIANGETVAFGDYFKGDNIKGIWGVYLCYTLIVVVGSFFFIPGIAAAILLWAAPAIKAEDPEKNIGECFKESMNLVTSNFGQMFLFYIVFSLVLSFFIFIPVVGALCLLPLKALGDVLIVRAAERRPAMRWP